MARIKATKNVRVEDIKPYENNAKIHNKKQLDKLAASIKEFGFVSPCLIDSEYNLIAGHGRLEAAKMIGLEEVPCTFIEGLNEAQRKAYILADNRLSELGSWDMDLVQAELESLEEIDFDFDVSGFEMPEVDLDSYYGDERERTNNAYNLDIAKSVDSTNDFWQMPVIKNDGFIPSRLIGFNYALTNKEKDTGIHFFVDDYQFERVWNKPDKYIDTLAEYECILSPDFSLYMDMPMSMKIWNIYRSRLIGSYYQNCGIKVIPTISWAEKETFDFCFLGIPEGSIVAVSTIGVKENKNALQVWHEGMDAMIEAIKPSDIIIYGGELEYNYGNIKTHYFMNEVTENWHGKN